MAPAQNLSLVKNQRFLPLLNFSSKSPFAACGTQQQQQHATAAAAQAW
jgi:hypothetical protein